MLKIATLLLALLMPLAALASSIDVAESGGLLTGSSAGLVFSGGVLDVFGATIGNLGTVKLSTTDLLSGNLKNGGIFEKGSTFELIGNGMEGIHNGIIFVGTFGKLTWKKVGSSYDLFGAFSGKWFNGQSTVGAFTLLTDATAPFNGKAGVASMDIVFNAAPTAVPEPATLTLFGLGLAGIATKLRRKKGGTTCAREV